MAFTSPIALTILSLFVALTAAQNASRPAFTEVTSAVGITQPRDSEQFGGPTVADLDGDGHLDLILTYHNLHPLRIYYGSASGRFTRRDFALKTDVHGVSVAQRTARSKDRLLVICAGGGRGTNLRPPFIYLAKPNRQLVDITRRFGFGEAAGRGRIAVFMDLLRRGRRESRRNRGGPDMLLINLLDNGRPPVMSHFAYQNRAGNYSLRNPTNLAKVNEERAIVTDIDNDGIMEVVHFSVFRVFKLTRPFTFTDITRTVVPLSARNLFRTISAVVELDFNNDGKMDLYLARANSNVVTPRGPPDVPRTDDILLMNVGGRYVDVSRDYGLPRDTDSMGVSAEDFNNDGYVDIVVTTFSGNDFLLLNQGGNRFRRFNLPEVPKPSSTRGHNVMALDYDHNGKVDLIFSQGFRQAFKGGYRLMRNELNIGRNTHFLLVRVGNEPTLACTSLNAIVTVHIGTQRLTRRVGGRGAMAGAQSNIDTVHFGLGATATVSRVTVRWTTGATAVRTNVRADRTITFGVGL